MIRIYVEVDNELILVAKTQYSNDADVLVNEIKNGNFDGWMGANYEHKGKSIQVMQMEETQPIIV